MTNQVEQLILKNEKQIKKLEYKENVAYLFYKEIWKFIIYSLNYDYDILEISFNIIDDHGSYYICKNEGINYVLENENIIHSWKTYHENTNNYFVNNVLNTSIDINLFYKLIESDNFLYKIDEEDKKNHISIIISPDVIEKIIENTYIKNKILKKR